MKASHSMTSFSCAVEDKTAAPPPQRIRPILPLTTHNYRGAAGKVKGESKMIKMMCSFSINDVSHSLTTSQGTRCSQPIAAPPPISLSNDFKLKEVLSEK
jgi:hypothetical protein